MVEKKELTQEELEAIFATPETLRAYVDKRLFEEIAPLWAEYEREQIRLLLEGDANKRQSPNVLGLLNNIGGVKKWRRRD